MGTETLKENVESFIFILDTLGTWEHLMFPKEIHFISPLYLLVSAFLSSSLWKKQQTFLTDKLKL